MMWSSCLLFATPESNMKHHQHHHHNHHHDVSPTNLPHRTRFPRLRALRCPRIAEKCAGLTSGWKWPQHHSTCSDFGLMCCFLSFSFGEYMLAGLALQKLTQCCCLFQHFWRVFVLSSRSLQWMDNQAVVSNIFYFHPYLGKISNLTSIFFRWVGSTTN